MESTAIKTVVSTHHINTGLIQDSATTTKEQLKNLERNLIAQMGSTNRNLVELIRSNLEVIQRTLQDRRPDVVNLYQQSNSQQSNSQLSRIESRIQKLTEDIVGDPSQPFKGRAVTKGMGRVRIGSSNDFVQHEMYLVRM